MSEVYYKLYKSERLNNKLTVVCLQYFDEIDYIEDRFLTDKNGNPYKFESEKKAINWLIENIKESMIDPVYLSKAIPKNSLYFK